MEILAFVWFDYIIPVAIGAVFVIFLSGIIFGLLFAGKDHSNKFFKKQK